MRILLAYSGGLDTSYLVASLAEAGHEVVACTVDCGGLTTQEKEDLHHRGYALGAAEVRCIDARQRLYDDVLRWLLAGNVLRGGVYPICVGAERGLQAEVLAEIAEAEGFDALAHGCTSAGNDQVRFEAALTILAPHLKILAPIREQPIARQDQVQWLKNKGLPISDTANLYSINAGLWGLTIGGGSLLQSEKGLPDDAWQWTKNGNQSASLSLQFEKGEPVAVNGKAMDPVELIDSLNQLGGQCGVGRGYHLGDTILGFKGRIAFEAPAAQILLSAHAELEKLVLTEDQRFWKDHLGEVYGRHVHQGLSMAPLLADIEAMFLSSQNRVSGEVHLQLQNGNVQVTGIQSGHSLMAASDAIYGESPAIDADLNAPLAFARVLAEPTRLYCSAS
jgi:argininosuccinate synthase